MSRHTSKQNSLSAQLGKKPCDCMYENKSIRTDASKQYLVDKEVADYWVELITEVLKEIPNSESHLLLRKALTEMRIIKES